MLLQDEPKVKNYLTALVWEAGVYYLQNTHRTELPEALNFTQWSFDNTQSDEATSFSSGPIQRSSVELYYSILRTLASLPETALNVDLTFPPSPDGMVEITIHVTNELLPLIVMEPFDNNAQHFIYGQYPNLGFRENELYNLIYLSSARQNRIASVYFISRLIVEGSPFHFVSLTMGRYQDLAERFQQSRSQASRTEQNDATEEVPEEERVPRVVHTLDRPPEQPVLLLTDTSAAQEQRVPLPQEPAVENQEDAIVTLPSGRSCLVSQLEAFVAELYRDLAFLENGERVPTAAPLPDSNAQDPPFIPR